jgi:nitrogen fixation-related uncharacterized protein
VTITKKARPPETGTARWRSAVTIGFAVVVLVVAGVGFTYKMSEFTLTIVQDDVEGFGAVAVGIYLIGMVPILFLTLWAVLTGRFRDIERPKYRVLELDREIERGGGTRYRVEVARGRSS